MAISLVESKTSTFTSSVGSITLTNTPQAGDLIVTLGGVSTTGEGVAITSLSSAPNATGYAIAVVKDNTALTNHASVCWKIADGTEAKGISQRGSGPVNGFFVVYVFRSTTGFPANPIARSGTANSASATSFTFAPLAIAQNDSVGVALARMASGGASGLLNWDSTGGAVGIIQYGGGVAGHDINTAPLTPQVQLSTLGSASKSAGAVWFYANESISATGLTDTPTFGTVTSTLSNSVSVSGINSTTAIGSPSVVLSAAPATDQSASVTGLSSSTSLGGPTLEPGAVSALPSGIQSGEALGSPTVAPGAVAIGDATSIINIASVGSPTLAPGAVIISVAGLDNTNALGSSSLQPGEVATDASGISVTSSIGTPSVSVGAASISASAIDSTAQIGIATTTTEYLLSVTGLENQSSFGTVSSVGAAQDVSVSGIELTNSFGTISFALGAVAISPDGIGSESVTGSSSLSSTNAISITGISSQVTFGSPGFAIPQSVTVAGITLTPSFGSTQVRPGAVVIAPAAFENTSALGEATLSSSLSKSITGIGPAATFGTLSITTAKSFSVDSLTTQPTIGSPTVSPSYTLPVAGIANEASLGSPTLQSSYEAQPVGIVSANVVGAPTFELGPVFIAAVGIDFGSLVGSVTVRSVYNLIVQGIDNSPLFGHVGSQKRVRKQRSSSMTIIRKRY